MSLYKEYEQLASIYHLVDNNTNKMTSYATTPAFTIKLFVHRRNEDAMALLGEEVGEYSAYVNATYTNAGNIVREDKVVVDGRTYIVKNRPMKVNLFNYYKLILKSND